MNKILLFLLIVLPFRIINSQVTFTDVAQQMGINYTNYGGQGGGLSFCDFNKDGFDDLSMCSTSNIPVGVFKNTGTAFQTFSIPPANNLLKSNCIVWADYDNDGYEDLLITSWGGVSRLYHNNSNASFTEVTQIAGLSLDSAYATGAYWADYDNDGYLDLYLNIYRVLGSPTKPNILYHNNKNGTFTNVTATAGVGALSTFPFVSTFIDYNNDGWPDIYVISDREHACIMYKNNGNGTFTDVSAQTGTNIVGSNMGVALGDYNNDGYLDIYVCNGEQGNFMLKNNGNGTFTNVTQQLGLGVYRICWGCNFFDYDNDGYQDLFVCPSNGAPDHPCFLFRNNGNGTFTRKTGIGLDAQHYSYGSAIGDFNNDGYPDIAVLNYYDNMNLYKNSGGTNKWLKIKLQGNVSNRDAIGSIVEVWRNGSKFIQSLVCGQSYLSQNSNTLIFGLGTSNQADSVIVRWPSGWRTRNDNITANQTITILENAPIGIINNHNIIPSSYKLMQNYPNPFNPATKIQYALPKAGYVRLEVFDILGSKVATLVNGLMQAGTYDAEFDASKFSSGVYMYRLTAGNYSATNKMILVK